MTTHNKNGVQYLAFDSFDSIKDRAGLCRHGFSTRFGGVSEDCFSSLNLRLNSSDAPGNVMENFRRVCDALDIPVSALVLSRQTHGTRIYDATEKDMGKGLLRESDIRDADGLATATPGVALVTFYADCVPLYFLGTKTKVIGLAHAGWKGTQANMAQTMVTHLQNRYNCRPADLLAGIGPSIGACCFETDLPVANMFREAYDFAGEFISPGENSKHFIDLKKINQRCMTNAGIPSENISTANECTKCRPDKYFSHRLSGENRGGMAAFLMLTP